MRTCKACGTKARRLTRAIVVGEDGATPGLVCSKCETRGVFIVPVLIAPVVKSAERKEAGEVLAPFIRTLEGQLRGLQSNAADDEATGNDEDEIDGAYLDGKIETFEGVIALLKGRRA